MNRSHTNWRMVPVLAGALVIATAVMPGEAGIALRHFGHVVANAIGDVHDGYMKLFR